MGFLNRKYRAGPSTGNVTECVPLLVLTGALLLLHNVGVPSAVAVSNSNSGGNVGQLTFNSAPASSVANGGAGWGIRARKVQRS